MLKPSGRTVLAIDGKRTRRVADHAVVDELRAMSKKMTASYRWCMRVARDQLVSIDVRHANASQGKAWLKAAQMLDRRAARLEKKR